MFDIFLITAIIPQVTQIKFYIPSEKIFYGYCNKATVYCSWDNQKRQIVYLAESDYITKQNSMETVGAIGLDDMSLGDTTEESDNVNIGRKYYFDLDRENSLKSEDYSKWKFSLFKVSRKILKKKNNVFKFGATVYF